MAVAEELSFTRAAARLRLAQPPLSRHVRSLEDRLGTRLFERTNRTVALTAAGRAFYADVREPLLTLQRAAASAKRAASGAVARLELGFVSSLLGPDSGGAVSTLSRGSSRHPAHVAGPHLRRAVAGDRRRTVGWRIRRRHAATARARPDPDSLAGGGAGTVRTARTSLRRPTADRPEGARWRADDSDHRRVVARLRLEDSRSLSRGGIPSPHRSRGDPRAGGGGHGRGRFGNRHSPDVTDSSDGRSRSRRAPGRAWRGRVLSLRPSRGLRVGRAGKVRPGVEAVEE